MATPEELLRKLDERFILGEIADEQYQQMRQRLTTLIEGPAAARISTENAAAPPGTAPSQAGGMDISDSVIKGNVTSGSASVGNINITVGQGSGASGPSAELEYEKWVMLTLRSGGSLESIRKELDDRRMAIGLPIRLAREIEAACLESCGRRPAHGQATDPRLGPAGPDPLKRFFKSASESLASMFGNNRPMQPGPPTNPVLSNPVRPMAPNPLPPGMRPPPFRPAGPPPVPWHAAPPPQAASGPAPAPGLTVSGSPAASPPAGEANSVKEAIKEELRAGLKSELAEAAGIDLVMEGSTPANAEAPAAPPMRKPPPLPAMPPPLRMPGPGKQGI